MFTDLSARLGRLGRAAALKVLIALLAFAGVVGAVFENWVVRGGAIVVVVVAGVGALVLVRRRGGSGDAELVSRYCDFVIERKLTPLVSVTNWHQKVYVQPNGDVREVVTIQAVALRDEVHFIRFHLGSEWDQPESQRKKVVVRATSITVDGVDCPQWKFTSTWLSPAKLRSIVHFCEPVRLGQEIRLEMTRFWPAKCLPLMRHGTPESFFFRTTELLRIQRLEYQVILPPGYEVTHEPVGFTEPDDHTSVHTYTDPDGRRVVICRASRLPERQSVGMRLEVAQPA